MSKDQIVDHWSTAEVIAEVSEVRPISRATFYRLTGKLGIKSLGMMRLKPALWPADTAQRILQALGLVHATALAGERPVNGHGSRVVGIGKLRATATRGRK